MQRLISYYHLARQSLPALTPYGFMLGLYAEVLGLAPMKEAQSDKDEDDACEQHETLIDQHNNQACSPCNQIFYGPPGTGKTYTLQALQKQYTSTPAHSDKLLWLQEKIAPELDAGVGAVITRPWQAGQGGRH